MRKTVASLGGYVSLPSPVAVLELSTSLVEAPRKLLPVSSIYWRGRRPAIRTESWALSGLDGRKADVHAPGLALSRRQTVSHGIP